MRPLRVVVLAILMSACNGSSPSATPVTAPTTTLGPVDGYPLSELLPMSVSGVATIKQDTTVANRFSARVFLKTVARLGKKPTDAEMAIASSSGASAYALRVDGVSGIDILAAFVAERTNVADGTLLPPTASVGGKQATKVGEDAGTYIYASGDVFYYIECPDEPTAVDVLQQLP
jgi:hypothetical protein